MSKKMTVYQYYLEMHELCSRLSKALLILDGEEDPLVEVYSEAEQTFYNKAMRMSVGQANCICSEERMKRLEDFRWNVKGREDAAAWRLNGKGNGSPQG